MSEEELIAEAKTLDEWSRHRFLIFIGASIVIAIILVIVSMHLYNSSGAAQLDLSRPGYQSVRKQASHAADFEGFPSTGALDETSLNEFKTLYTEKEKEATGIDSFGGDVLSDKALSIEAPKK